MNSFKNTYSCGVPNPSKRSHSDVCELIVECRIESIIGSECTTLVLQLREEREEFDKQLGQGSNRPREDY